MNMRQIRDEVMEQRIKFLRAFGTYPTQLFASPEWAARVSHYMALELGSPPDPVQGKGFYNMLIHEVPTLQRGFYIA